MEKHLGKISQVSFGYCGYQDVGLGISFTLDFNNGGCCDSRSFWDANLIKHTKNCEWSEQDRDKNYADIMRFISGLLKDAKVKSVDKLKDKPVEVITEKNTLKSWRILTEVL